MWLKISLLALLCAYLTCDVIAHAAGRQFSKPGSLPQQKPGPYSGYGRRAQLGRGGEQTWNYGGGRNSNAGSFLARPENSKKQTSFGRADSGRRFRRDYGSGFNGGFMPGGGMYGPRFGYAPYGGGDFGSDMGYGSDNWRRE